MTIGGISPIENGGDSRGKKVFDEKAPLLPSKQEEAREFDEFNGASFAGSVFNLSTTIVGAGIMSLPATMKVLGLVPGILLIIFFAFFTEISIDMLVRFSRAGKTGSYGGLMGDSFGRIGKMLIQLCIIVNNVGVLIVYMIIIGMFCKIKIFLIIF